MEEVKKTQNQEDVENIYKYAVADVYKAMNTQETGLTASEALRIQGTYGKNVIKEKKRNPCHCGFPQKFHQPDGSASLDRRRDGVFCRYASTGYSHLAC